jgi:anti-sigma B factor antagonist
MSALGRRRADAQGGLRLRAGLRSRVMTDRPPRAFEVDDAGLRDAPGVAVHGEVDINYAPALEAALDVAIRDSVGAFIIDLSDLEFIDSSGLQVLLRARGLLGREDRALAVVCPFGPVRRVFELSGSSELFALYPSREAAAAALVPADERPGEH